MIKLSKLTKIAEDKEARKNRLIERVSQIEKDKFEKQYQDAINGLEKKLIKAAEEGKRSLTVASFSSVGYGLFETIPNELHSMVSKSGNFYCAWRDKVITEEDVIFYMTGNLRRVYQYLKSQNLNPKIQHWSDGHGEDEGFEIVVKW